LKKKKDKYYNLYLKINIYIYLILFIIFQPSYYFILYFIFFFFLPKYQNNPLSLCAVVATSEVGLKNLALNLTDPCEKKNFSLGEKSIFLLGR
jgi:hypothetical protein